METNIPQTSTESINLLTNYTTDLHSKNSRIEVFTDNVMTMTGGFIDNVIDPSAVGIPGELLRAVSKNYIDNATSNVSVPLNSVQKSSGSSFLGSNGLLYLGPTVGLKVDNKIQYSNGAGTIQSNNILNTSSTVLLDTDGAVLDYTYFSNIKSVSITTTVSSNDILASNVINTSFTRISTVTGIIQDILPSPADIIVLIPGVQIGSSFTFIYKYFGIEPSVLLYGRIVLNGNFLVYNNPVEAVTVPDKSVYKFLGYVESITPPLVTYYVINQQSLEGNNQQITPIGLKTDNFRQYLNSVNDTNIIYPLVQSTINATGGVTYTVDNIKGLLITRSSLSVDSTDSLPTSVATSFPIGSGLISFTVQNVSNYNLVVGNGGESGVTYGTGTRTIASSSVGTFDMYVDTSANTYTIYSTGITSMNGA